MKERFLWTISNFTENVTANRWLGELPLPLKSAYGTFQIRFFLLLLLLLLLLTFVVA